MILGLNIVAAIAICWFLAVVLTRYIDHKLERILELERGLAVQARDIDLTLNHLDEVRVTMNAKLIAVEAAIKVVVPFAEKLDKVY